MWVSSLRLLLLYPLSSEQISLLDFGLAFLKAMYYCPLQGCNRQSRCFIVFRCPSLIAAPSKKTQKITKVPTNTSKQATTKNKTPSNIIKNHHPIPKDKILVFFEAVLLLPMEQRKLTKEHSGFLKRIRFIRCHVIL